MIIMHLGDYSVSVGSLKKKGKRLHLETFHSVCWWTSLKLIYFCLRMTA